MAKATVVGEPTYNLELTAAEAAFLRYILGKFPSKEELNRSIFDALSEVSIPRNDDANTQGENCLYFVRSGF